MELSAHLLAVLQVLVLREFCITPEVFDVVKFPSLPVKNMNHCVEAVQANPSGSLYALHVERWLAQFVLEALVYITSNGLDLSGGVPLADDEKIRGGIVQFSEVKFHDVFSFDVLNAIDDEVVQRFNGGGGRL